VLTVTNPSSGLSATAPFTITDGTVPVVTIGSPVEGTELTTRTILVTGTVSEPATVLVNGVVAALGTGSPIPFQATVVLDVDAPRVVVTATDASGNRGTAVVSVRLTDVTAPSLTLAASPAVLWPPNHQMVPVAIDVAVSDDTDPAPVVELLSVVSSEPDDAPGSGDGATTGDIQDVSVGTDDRQVSLRAEREGGGPGRVYTLTYRATDAAGNSTIAAVQVVVPNDVGR
jgi:hypothetical protein